MLSSRAHCLLRNALKTTPIVRPFQVRQLYQTSFLFTPLKWRQLPINVPRRFISSRTNHNPLNTLKLPRRTPVAFFASNSTLSPHGLPPLSPPSVGYWLLFSSALVFSVIVVGGVTRLTESGLSITEWKPITGIIPPITQAQWEEEFEKYKATPEYKLLNHRMTLPEFKKIYHMEHGHRVLGRVIGIVFFLPFLYFLKSKSLGPKLPYRLGFLASLIGFQGFLGWYMVKSGLEDSFMDTPGAIPRVSQYRLAAHLGAAIVLYAGMLRIGYSVLRDWKFVKKDTWNGVSGDGWQKILNNSRLQRFTKVGWLLTGLVLVTALSGAFVAGLDAGLVYNEFPTMGGRLVPPTDELYSTNYTQNLDKSDIWRNIFENPTTVQFNHRVLAITTYLSTAAFYVSGLSLAKAGILPPITRTLVTAAFAAANVQVALGISTLLYLVPIPLAAAHQAGSIALLTAMIAVVTSLRQPGLAARLWRNFYRVSGKASKSAST
ncbi:hypothetical protein M422DRAFT_218050 [Sphaerobolus stellatus SS14]|nr:hypothetical protein M422DRAFT_218050 [Sphaerobolus stellatus SS14]